MAKFKTLSFCQKVILWLQTSSCKCPMCQHCVYKVSGCFSKSCGTKWTLRICTTYATLRITKGNHSNRIGPWPLIFYYKCTFDQYQCVCKIWWIFHHCLFKILKKNQKRHGRKDGRMWKQYTPHPLTNIVWEGYNKMASAPAKTQISLGIHLLSLIRVFAVCMKKAWVLSYPMSTQWRLIRQGEGGCPGWSESSLGAQLFVSFVMRRLNWPSECLLET